MAEDKHPDPLKDTSKPGKEEEVIPNANRHGHNEKDPSRITTLPIKDDKAHNETEGERRFKEGMANNDDPASS